MVNTGLVGQERGVGVGIFLYIITFGIYGLYWTYMTFDEMSGTPSRGWAVDSAS